MGVEEGEEIQTEDIDNLFNRLIAENSLTSRKRESVRCRKLTEHQTVRTKKETPQDTSQNVLPNFFQSYVNLKKYDMM
jgi:hypothetical protein